MGVKGKTRTCVQERRVLPTGGSFEGSIEGSIGGSFFAIEG